MRYDLTTHRICATSFHFSQQDSLKKLSLYLPLLSPFLSIPFLNNVDLIELIG